MRRNIQRETPVQGHLCSTRPWLDYAVAGNAIVFGCSLPLLAPQFLATTTTDFATRFVMMLAAAGVILLGFATLVTVQQGRSRRCAEAEARELRESLAQNQQQSGKSEEQFRMLFSLNPHPMWVLDTETLRYLDVNNAALRQYGYSREEFLQLTARDIRPPEDVPHLERIVRELPSGYHSQGVWRHKRKDGTLLYVEITTVKFDVEGQGRELVLALDITGQVESEEALHKSRLELQSLVDNAPFGIFRTSLTEDRMAMTNSAIRKMLGGYSEDEITQLVISKDIYIEPGNRVQILDMLQRDGKVEAVETTLRRRDGSPVAVHISGVLVPGPSDELNYFEGYVEDVSERSALERQMRQIQKLEAVGKLAGGVAHDFNNILVVIKLSTELMLSEITPDSPLMKPLLQVSNATDRAASLTRQMLAFGRQQLMRPRVINLNTVVTDISRMLRRIIGEDIHLVTTLSDSLHNARVDPDQLGQVIMNLAVNARDAMPEGGTLQIETGNVQLDSTYCKAHAPVQPGSYVMLAVTDTGIGIEKAILPHIFDPFFTTKDVGKGTGLGLSIVYGIVKQSNGYIWAYSEPRHGTTFKLYFPVCDASIDSESVPEEAVYDSSGQTVLVVEDETDIRHNVKACLEQLGYRVLEAANGEEALRTCLPDSHVDLVLTDLVMPQMGGQELAAVLAKNFPSIRIVFMSGYTESSAVRREILDNDCHFLQKPFSVAELSSAIHDALLRKTAIVTP